MRHDITIDGPVFRLRPVEMRDAAFIVALRTDPRCSQFIHATSPQVADQQLWLERYFERAGDYYFIIERLESGQAEGTVALYDEDRAAQCAEWGRWIARMGSGAGVEGLLLIYRVAFSVLHLEMTVARTIDTNARALAVHAAYGLQPYRRLPRFVQLDDIFHDVVEHRMTRSMWPEYEEALARLATLAAHK